MRNQRTFRSLEGYKKMHEKTAKNKGCFDSFMASKTLTQAKRILFGEKEKSYVKYRGWSAWK